jgi:hypothetical protein
VCVCVCSLVYQIGLIHNYGQPFDHAMRSSYTHAPHIHTSMHAAQACKSILSFMVMCTTSLISCVQMKHRRPQRAYTNDVSSSTTYIHKRRIIVYNVRSQMKHRRSQRAFTNDTSSFTTCTHKLRIVVYIVHSQITCIHN